MSTGTILAAVAGLAIAAQVVVNAVALRVLGLGALIGVSGLTTAAAGLAISLSLSRPEFTGRAVLCAVASGLLGAFILSAILLASVQGGVARTLSLVIASQLIAGLAVDRLGLFGPASQEIGLSKLLGVALILVGGVLVVRS